MIDQNNKQLSPQGEERKEEMLSQLVGQMNHIHNARKVRRRVIHTLTLVIICAITVWVVSLKLLNPQPNRIVIEHPLKIEAPPTAKMTLVKNINDDELIALLAQINRPAGIVRSQGRIWLTNAVTDEELGISRDTPDEDPS
ncbi:MAG: hypothetical protein IH984_03895 [Planctomycetes bacterium]|nr:hypothetical protein [Planctomycetota bacterium]